MREAYIEALWVTGFPFSVSVTVCVFMCVCCGTTIKTSNCQYYLLPAVDWQLSEGMCLWNLWSLWRKKKNLWRDSTHGLAVETKTRTEEEEGRRWERELRKNRRTYRARERGRDRCECAFPININQSRLSEWFQQCLCWQISTSSKGLSGALLSTRPFCTFTPVITHWF